MAWPRAGAASAPIPIPLRLGQIALSRPLGKVRGGTRALGLPSPQQRGLRGVSGPRGRVSPDQQGAGLPRPARGRRRAGRPRPSFPRTEPTTVRPGAARGGERRRPLPGPCVGSRGACGSESSPFGPHENVGAPPRRSRADPGPGRAARGQAGRWAAGPAPPAAASRRTPGRQRLAGPGRRARGETAEQAAPKPARQPDLAPGLLPGSGVRTSGDPGRAGGGARPPRRGLRAQLPATPGPRRLRPPQPWRWGRARGGASGARTSGSAGASGRGRRAALSEKPAGGCVAAGGAALPGCPPVAPASRASRETRCTAGSRGGKQVGRGSPSGPVSARVCWDPAPRSLASA